MKWSCSIFLFSLLGSCICPEKDSAVPYKSFDQEFLSYTDYKNGSYWIYEQQNSAKTDSVYITSYFKKTLVDSDLSDREVNTDQLTMQWVIDGQVWIGHTSVYKERDEYFFTYILKNAVSNKEEVLYDHKPVPVNDSCLKTTFHALIEHKETYTIQGQTYSDVKVFLAATEDHYFQKVYWAAHAGIIRMELNDGEVWELVRYKMIQ